MQSSQPLNRPGASSSMDMPCSFIELIKRIDRLTEQVDIIGDTLLELRSAAFDLVDEDFGSVIQEMIYPDREQS